MLYDAGSLRNNLSCVNSLSSLTLYNNIPNATVAAVQRQLIHNNQCTHKHGYKIPMVFKLTKLIIYQIVKLHFQCQIF